MSSKELKRLETVNRILNLKIKKEKEFQQIVDFAAEMCEADTAYLTLIDEDTQYIRFKFGRGPNKAERRDTFCDHVINQLEVLVVADTLQDDRFINNHYVCGDPSVRFYAGAPLTTSEGLNIGSLCVLDHKARVMTVVQQKILANLAMQVITLLEFEYTLDVVNQQFAEAKNYDIKIRAFFESSSSCHILLDPDLRIIAFNRAVKDFVRNVYGVNMSTNISIKPFVGEAYMEDFINNCTKALSGQSIRHERCLQFNEDKRWWALSYDPAKDPSGKIIGISYESTDITDRVREEQKVIHQNESLRKIAYIQSHELRRPVASIMGLMNVFKMEDFNVTREGLMMMDDAVNELDEKIRQIVKYTDSDINGSLLNGYKLMQRNNNLE